VHAILDNLQVYKTPEVKQWLEDHPRWPFHFTPTHASWLNQIELFFSILIRRLLIRGVFTSKADLRTQLLAFIERYTRPRNRSRGPTKANPFTHDTGLGEVA
jgi:transposase